MSELGNESHHHIHFEDCDECKDYVVKAATKASTERRSYVVLAVVLLIMTVGLGAFVINYVHNNNHIFCDIIKASLPAHAPAMPTNPNAKGYADALKHYNGYILTRDLGRRLGCLS